MIHHVLIFELRGEIAVEHLKDIIDTVNIAISSE